MVEFRLLLLILIDICRITRAHKLIYCSYNSWICMNWILTCSFFTPQIKAFALDILKRSSKVWVTELLANLDTMWDTIDTEFSQKGKAGYFIPLQKCIFNFLTKSIVGADPAKSPDIAKSGYIMLDLWLGLQLLPTIPITAFQPLVEILFHTFTYPAFLVSGGYNKLYEFIKKEGNKLCFYMYSLIHAYMYCLFC